MHLPAGSLLSLLLSLFLSFSIFLFLSVSLSLSLSLYLSLANPVSVSRPRLASTGQASSPHGRGPDVGVRGYSVTSLIGKGLPLGSYRMLMPRALWWS